MCSVRDVRPLLTQHSHTRSTKLLIVREQVKLESD